MVQGERSDPRQPSLGQRSERGRSAASRSNTKPPQLREVSNGSFRSPTCQTDSPTPPRRINHAFFAFLRVFMCSLSCREESLGNGNRAHAEKWWQRAQRGSKPERCRKKGAGICKDQGKLLKGALTSGMVG